MRDGVDEGILLFIAADFAHQKEGIQHHSADQHGQQGREVRP